MKRIFLSLGLVCASLGMMFAQVKIGNNPQTLSPSSLLELESTDRVLVLTRVTQAQMDAISPLMGALVYNTDAGCIYQHNGTLWVNLCQAFNVSLTDNLDGTYTFSNGQGPVDFDGTGVSGFEINTQGELVLTKSNGQSFTVPLQNQINNSFTTDAIVNPAPSIVITDTGTSLNFEVSEITGNNIADGSINGFNDIQFKSIFPSQMSDNSITTPAIATAAVTEDKIDFSSVTLQDFINDLGFLSPPQMWSVPIQEMLFRILMGLIMMIAL